MIGDANSPPTLKATSDFEGLGLIDADPYYGQGLNWASTTVFFRQIRNFAIDTTAIPAGKGATGIHWPSSQATSLQNIVFNMPISDDVAHVGVFMEEGSGGLLTDLTFNGGRTGLSMGNQQYTTKNLVFNGCKTAILQIWNWGWTYIGVQINNCGVGLDMSLVSGNGDLNVGSVTFIDSDISNTNVGILIARTSSTSPVTAGSLILENIRLENVEIGVKGPNGTLLDGGTGTIDAWGTGRQYTPNGPEQFQGGFEASRRPSTLTNDGKYYLRTKPQYADKSSSDFLGVRSVGAKGDGSTDDTAAIQRAINQASSTGKILFIDHGVYVITDTILVPPGTRIVGEAYPTLLSSGGKFADMNSPRAVLKVGETSGQSGQVELSDFMISTRGAQGGAALIEWNLDTSGTPSGMWDVHTRIGGFVGSNLQTAQCEKRPGNTNVPEQCVAAFMSMHITKGAGGLYMENCWLWTADHDLDGGSNTQIDIYAGRGLLIEATKGRFWQVGTSVEHHTLYQYQFANTKDVFAGQIQTESPYYQPSPNTPLPFPINKALHDPEFDGLTHAYGYRVVDSSGIFTYGAGLYSFFSNWNATCSTFAAGSDCQSKIMSLEGALSNVNIYNLNTVGTVSMLNRDGTSVAKANDNVNVFNANVALYRAV